MGSLGVVALPFDIIGAVTGIHTDKIVSGWTGNRAWPGEGPAPVKPFPAPLLNLKRGQPCRRRALSAGLGEANTVGALSVPPTWTVATPAVRPVALTLPALPPTAATAGGAAERVRAARSARWHWRAWPGEPWPARSAPAAAAVPGHPGRAAVRPARTGRTSEGTLATDDDAPQSKPRTVVTGVAAELREFAKLRDEGILTDEEYTEQKNRLLGR